MRVNSIYLKNFKRFTELAIEGIPETAKLVVVVGPNGCGKSSLFDAFIHWHRYKTTSSWKDDSYYRKDKDSPFQGDQVVNLTLHGNEVIGSNSLYIRTAYRNESDFSISNIRRPNDVAEELRNRRLIDDDKSVSQNYQRIVYQTAASLYDERNDKKNVKTLREELIGEIQASMRGVFGDLVLNNVSNPFDSSSEGSTFLFDKGSSKSFQYKNLSGGEKAAFDLLLDIHLKKLHFTNSIYCIDEIEAHLHTGVQGILLKELVEVVPNNSQLWTTTHALGVIRAAQNIEGQKPGSVCIINFEDVSLDRPSVLRPTVLDKVSWEKMLSMTLDDMSEFIAPRVIVVCEGSSVGSRRKNFDANVYSTILSTQEPGIIFVAGGASSEVQRTRAGLQDLLQAVLPSSRIVALADRDDKSVKQIADWSNRGDIVLSERNLESYLLADDVIESLTLKEGKPELREEALRVRDNAIESSISRGNPPDDVKSASGETFNGLKSLLAIQHPGENADVFMRDILAPLIKPGMPTYQRLKEDIIDKLA